MSVFVLTKVFSFRTSETVFDRDTLRQRGDRDNVENVAILLMWTRPNMNDPNLNDALNRLRWAPPCKNTYI